MSRETTMRRRLIIATRKSALALAQCRAWIKELKHAHPGLVVEELHVTTTGDRIVDRSLSDIGGKGLFVKEIEEALLAGQADLAVHSLKDLPAALVEGLCIGCIPVREDPRDVLVSRDGRSFVELENGAKLGTSSLRRGVQLGARRPDLEVVPLRGNVDTRLRKCEEGVVDAIVLARAGLNRLGLAERATETLTPELCLPAVGQGALAVEHRQDDTEIEALLAPLHHAETAIAVHAERGLMAAAEGNCQTPIAAYATREGDQLWLRGMLAEPDGTRARFDELSAVWPDTASAAEALGRELGQRLLLS